MKKLYLLFISTVIFFVGCSPNGTPTLLNYVNNSVLNNGVIYYNLVNTNNQKYFFVKN